jgi:hypothetical protein
MPLFDGIRPLRGLGVRTRDGVEGVASPSLLGTYHDERQPVARAITEQSSAVFAKLKRQGIREGTSRRLRGAHLPFPGTGFVER